MSLITGCPCEREQRAAAIAEITPRLAALAETDAVEVATDDGTFVMLAATALQRIEAPHAADVENVWDLVDHVEKRLDRGAAAF